MATIPAAPTQTMTPAERANQRNAVLAGFLGWTLDAFDFFILTLVIDDIAKSFGRSRPDIAFTLTVTLLTRPLGATSSSASCRSPRPPAAADDQRDLLRGHLGRVRASRPAIRCSSSCACSSASRWEASGRPAPSLALESASPRLRGLLSGLLQEGYALGNLLAALAFSSRLPRRSNQMLSRQRLAADVFPGRRARHCSPSSSGRR